MCCHSSQESAVSTSVLSGPDSAPSPSLSAIPPASTGSVSTGRESRSTGTSTPFQASLFEDLWISSVEASPASRSASPVSKKGPKTSATSGPRCHESSEKSDPALSLLKTFLASELSRLTSSLKTWKDRGTPAGRSWWVLMTSEGRTEGKESGSSRENWITPTQEDANKPFGDGPKATAGRGATSSQRLRNQLHWPTATAGDAKASGSRSGNPNTKAHPGVSLTDAIQRQWPTLRAEDSEQTGGHRGTPDTLTSASRLWARPQARDWKDSGPTQGNRKSPNLGTQCAGLLAPESPSTLGKPQDWPTPTAHDGRRPGVDIHSTQGGNLSRDVAKEWATPQAHDAAPGDASRVGRYGTKHGGRNLNDETVAMEWPTPRANRHGAPDSHGKAPIRGSLNPRWVAQLMGFPTDWLDSPPPIAANPSKRSATRSRLPAPTTSGEPS